MELITNLETSLYWFCVQVLLLFFLIIIFLTKNLSKTRKNKGLKLPPGPPTWPIIGNLAGIITNKPSFKWIHRVMDEKQTDIACFRFGRVHVIAITSSEIAREALKDKDDVFADRPETYSAGLVSCGFKNVGFSRYGDQWKKMRRVMASAVMSPKTLNMLLGERTLEANNLLAYVHNLYMRSKTVNLRDIARTYAYAVTTRMLFGRRPLKEAAGFDDGGLGAMEKELVDAIFKMTDCLFSVRALDYVPFLNGWDLDRQEKKARDAAEVLVKYNDIVVDERIEMWKEKGGKENVKDWLDILISAKDTQGKPLLTPEEIRAECMEISFASMDNGPNNVEWTLAEMLNQTETLKKAVDELDKVVGKDRLVQESDIPNLNFIKACSRESFRLHPVAPFVVPHATTEDISLAGYFIPKGSHILMDHLGLGRNPRTWDEPHVFKPERHLGCNGSQQEISLHEPEMRFVSFSTDRRSCVASKVGTYITVIPLATLLQGFDWSLPQGSGSGQIELVESETSMFLAKPLVASAKPRLAPHMYPKFRN